ncbi:unnamed protein product [Trichogramma brassicae]|uniref:Integrase catalytic domain-containing protein n=1 Tax=Trichogramma brassicae TaxID=86971 RepID=A0A6H5IWB0_9HYME|nr:unnamed protein product [Trichogramma brassicae]
MMSTPLCKISQTRSKSSPPQSIVQQFGGPIVGQEKCRYTYEPTEGCQSDTPHLTLDHGSDLKNTESSRSDPPLLVVAKQPVAPTSTPQEIGKGSLPPSPERNIRDEQADQDSLAIEQQDEPHRPREPLPQQQQPDQLEPLQQQQQQQQPPVQVDQINPLPLEMANQLPPALNSWEAFTQALMAHRPSLPEYNGLDHENPTSYLTKCDEYCTALQIPDEQKLSVLEKGLKGSAEKWWQCYKSMGLTYARFSELLKAQYDGQALKSSLMAKLCGTTQGEKESSNFFVFTTFVFAAFFRDELTTNSKVLRTSAFGAAYNTSARDIQAKIYNVPAPAQFERRGRIYKHISRRSAAQESRGNAAACVCERDCGSRRIRPDPDKTAPMANFPAPKTLKQLRRFPWNGFLVQEILGEILRRSLSRLHVSPAREKNFTWAEDQQNSFEKIRGMLATAPVLNQPSFEHEFVIQTDASDTGLGAVLTQTIDNTERVFMFREPHDECRRAKFIRSLNENVWPYYGRFRNSARMSKDTTSSQRGNEYILVFVDEFTRWVEVIPILQGQRPDDPARELNERIFLRFGVPDIFHSDNGTEFKNKIVDKFLKERGVKHTTIAPYADHQNPTKRVNRTFKTRIIAYIEERHNTWGRTPARAHLRV